MTECGCLCLLELPEDVEPEDLPLIKAKVIHCDKHKAVDELLAALKYGHNDENPDWLWAIYQILRAKGLDGLADKFLEKMQMESAVLMMVKGEDDES